LHRGLETFIEKVPPGNDEVTYRVRVGPYAARSEAEEIAKEIFQHTGQQAIILPADPPREPGAKPS
jgi:cell division septation protein DedD